VFANHFKNSSPLMAPSTTSGATRLPDAWADTTSSFSGPVRNGFNDALGSVAHP